MPTSRGNGLTKKQLGKRMRPIIEKQIVEIEAKVKRHSQEGLQETETRSYAMHLADISGDQYEKEFSAEIVAKDLASLNELKYALEKIEKGSYGVCEDCGCNIPLKRLEIMPGARYCVSCEEKRDK